METKSLYLMPRKEHTLMIERIMSFACCGGMAEWLKAAVLKDD